MKGILLCGGSGTRLAPITTSVPKSLLPVYDKPMVYYALTTLMQARIREILVISTPHDSQSFRRLLGNGSQWGLMLDYEVQEKPAGIAQAWIIAESWLEGSSSCLVLGDNILYGDGIGDLMVERSSLTTGASIFAYHVADPSRYGVVEIDPDGRVVAIEEKPSKPKSKLAMPGVYFVDGRAPGFAAALSPSARGELEVVDLLRAYMPDELQAHRLRRGFAWLDAGTHESLLDSSNFIATLERRMGLQIGDPSGIARDRGWI